MSLKSEIKKSGAAVVWTKGALDRMMPLLFSATGRLRRPVRMMSEIKKGEEFVEYNHGPLRVASANAYITKIEDGTKIWAVPFKVK